MVEVNVSYLGDLRCEAVHGPSGMKLLTDAPVDNMGKGEAFSPTDLVGTAMGTCMLTIMGIVAQRHAIDLKGASINVKKEMVTQPVRRIGKLSIEIRVPAKLSDEDKKRLETAAMTCPVHKSMHPDVEIPVTFVWG